MLRVRPVTGTQREAGNTAGGCCPGHCKAFSLKRRNQNKHEQQSHRNGEIHREENFGEVRRNAVVTA